MQFPIAVDFTPNKLERHRDLTAAARKAIVEGRLKTGERLPSAQELAVQVGVGRSTIVKVYQQLAAEGYLECKVGSGTYVKTGVVSGDAGTVPEQSARDAEVAMRFAPPRDVLPVRSWQQLLMRHSRSDGSTGGACVLGYRPLRQSIAEFLRLTKGINCTANQVAIFPSAQAALYFITSHLVNRDDLVVVENPAEPAVTSSLGMAGARVKSVDVDAAGLKVQDLETIAEPCKLLFVSPSHHFPTGAIMPLERRHALLEWARRSQALVVEDARDSDYYYGRGAIPALQGLDDDGRVVYLYDFSTVLSPLVNIAVLVLPASLIETATQAMLWLGSALPSVEHFALNQFVAEGDLQRHVRRSHAIYQSRRQILIYHLSQHFLRDIAIPSCGAGLHQVVRFKLPLQQSDVLKCAALSGLPMIPIQSYYSEPVDQLEFLIPFCMLEPDTIEETIAKFKRLIQQELRTEVSPASAAEMPAAHAEITYGDFMPDRCLATV